MTDHSALIERLEAGCIFHPRHYWIVDPDKTDALLAEAAKALRDLTEWRDIATAPKDGTKFDGWQRDERVCDMHWSDVQDAWCVDGDYGPEEPTPLAFFPRVSHWLPLPSAPNQAKEAGE